MVTDYNYTDIWAADGYEVWAGANSRVFVEMNEEALALTRDQVAKLHAALGDWLDYTNPRVGQPR